VFLLPGLQASWNGSRPEKIAGQHIHEGGVCNQVGNLGTNIGAHVLRAIVDKNERQDEKWEFLAILLRKTNLM